MDELLHMLVCPESKQRLVIAEAQLLDRLNCLIQKGSLKNRGGELIEEKLEAGLVREDGRWLYPIRNGIPVMIVEEAIALDEIEVIE